MEKSEIVYQVAKFLDYARRVGGHWEQTFTAWADSKDFCPSDREAIFRGVDRTMWAGKDEHK